MQVDRIRLRAEIHENLKAVLRTLGVGFIVESYDLLFIPVVLPACVWQIHEEEPGATFTSLKIVARLLPDLTGDGRIIRGADPAFVAAEVCKFLSAVAWVTPGVTLYEEPHVDPGLTTQFIFGKGPFVVWKLKYTP